MCLNQCFYHQEMVVDVGNNGGSQTKAETENIKEKLERRDLFLFFIESLLNL